MSSQPFVLTDPNTLAEFVRESELSSFFEKRYATPPDLAALLFRNGQLVDTYIGAHFSVGGLANSIKRAVGGSSHIALMLADLKPFQVQLAVCGLSKDNVEIEGLATFELQLNPEKSANILGLMGGVSRMQSDEETGDIPETGRKALSRIDVLERLAPHFKARVFQEAIERVNAEDIRGESGLQDKIQADAMKEAERICGDLGVLVRSATVEWAVNQVEIEAFQKAEISRQQELLDYQLEILKREVGRQSEATVFQIESKVDVAKVESASEDELAHMVLESEVRFLDAREEATRRQEMQALAHEIEVLRTERSAKMKLDLAEASHLIDLTKETATLRKVEREIELLDTKHIAEMKKIGAFTDLEIHERKERLELALAKEASKMSADNLERLKKIEQDAEDRGADRDIKKQKAETDSRVAQLQAGAKMTPEQILAINAGLSSDVADVLKEQAKASAGAGESSMEAMRELVKGAAEERQAERDHQLNILKAGMAGASGVAHGAGGKSDGGLSTEGLETSSSTIECSKCGRENSAKSKFCVGCGHKLRT